MGTAMVVPWPHLLDNRDRPEDVDLRALRTYVRWEYGDREAEWFLRAWVRPARHRVWSTIRRAAGRLRLRARPMIVEARCPDAGR